jgi:HK97 family phage major capsid protein
MRSFLRAGRSTDGGYEWAPRVIEFKMTAEHKQFMEQRDLTKAVTTAGGFTVPTGFISRLYEQLVEAATVRQTGAIIYTTDSGENLLVPKATSHGAAALVAEAAAIAESDSVFAQQTLTAYKYGQLIEVSTELIQDSGIDLLGYLSRAAGRGLGLASGTHFVTGTGTGQPEGVATNVTTGKTGLTGQTTTVITDDLFDLYHSIVSGYRSRGVWLMNDSSLAKIRKLKDTTGQFLWQPGLQAGTPDSLLGRPVLTDPNVAVMAASAKSILFGDFSSYYAIRDVSGVRFERSDDFRFANDLVAFRALIRTDGKPMDATAVKAYVNSAT